MVSGSVAPGEPSPPGSDTVRPTADTMPLVTLLVRPNGLPIANTMSPTATLLESGRVADVDHGQVVGRVRTDERRLQSLRGAGWRNLERGGGSDHVRVGDD